MSLPSWTVPTSCRYTVGPDPVRIVEQVLDRLEAGRGELVTLYYGAEIDADQAEGLATRLRATYPGQQVEVVSGGQPLYYYVVAVE